MFYLVDCIQRRFNSRSVVEISGVFHLTPNLGIVLLIMCMIYGGLPGTLKFVSEFYIFSSILENSTASCFFLLLFANVLGLIGFSKC
jgi:NADH:ubiquinone oxidoreductase subunit 4 (subunit M)